MGDDFGAENLEDGELWLPSDFFSVDEAQVPSKTRTSFRRCSSSSKAVMKEDFQSPTNTGVFCRPLPTLQMFNPAVWNRYASFSVNAYDRGIENCWTGNFPVHHLQRLSQVQKQIEAFMVEWVRAERRRQLNWLILNRVTCSQAGTGSRGGTGVFLPHVSSNTTVAKEKGPQAKSSYTVRQLSPPREMSPKGRQEQFSGRACMPHHWDY